MASYFVINACISLLVLFLLIPLRKSKPGFQLILVAIALVLWLLPTHKFRYAVPLQNQSQFMTYYTVFSELEFVEAQPAPVTKSTPQQEIPWFALLLLSGMLMAGLRFSLFKRQLRRQRILTQPYGQSYALNGRQYEIRVLPNFHGAMAVGLLRPEIWIGADHVGTARFEQMVQHELTHIEHGDNWIKLGLFLMKTVFWWNPLVLLLCAKTDLLCELRCDRACQTHNPGYRHFLAELVLSSHQGYHGHSALAQIMYPKTKTNMIRIKALEEKSMQFSKVHKILLVLFATFGALLFAKPYNEDSPMEASQEIARAGQAGVEVPVFTRRVSPVYPKAAVREKISGYVILEAIFGADGVIREVKVLRGLGDGAFGFEASAMDAVKQWEFEPGKVGGVPADVRMTLKLDFVLKSERKMGVIGEANHEGFKKVTARIKTSDQSWEEAIEAIKLLEIPEEAYMWKGSQAEVKITPDGELRDIRFDDTDADIAGLQDQFWQAANAMHFSEFEGEEALIDFPIYLSKSEYIEAGGPLGFRRVQYQGVEIEPFHIVDMALYQFMEQLAKQASLKLELEPGISLPDVTYKFNGINFELLLEIVLNNAQLYFDIQDDQLRVGTFDYVYAP